MTAIAAILLVCSHGDRDVAASVHAAAVHAGVDPAMAVAVACVESGLSAKSQNPLGVRSCYGSVTHRPPIAECIAIGARSLANRLRGANGNEATALRIYNGSANAAKYAAQVLRIARFVRGRVR